MTALDQLGKRFLCHSDNKKSIKLTIFIPFTLVT